MNGCPHQVVRLLFPPGWTPFSPYLALPCLKAFLEGAGIPARIDDLNLEFFDKILSIHWLQSRMKLISGYIEKYEQSSRLSPNQQRHFNLAVRASQLYDSILGVEAAKETMRSQSFYQMTPYNKAKQTLTDCLGIASSSFYGASIHFNEICVRIDYSDKHDLDRFLCDVDRNPYFEFTNNYVRNDVDLLNSQLIGISITSESQFLSALTLARIIRTNATCQTHITFGGNYITRISSDPAQRDRIMEYCDSIIISEGETALSKLALALETGGPLNEIPNLIYKQNCQIFNTPRSRQISGPYPLQILTASRYLCT
jgi:anaerobic magnesium-protoporphyrin IX monomethyl ester cyclase